jgi:hypothetical protein
MNTIQTRVLINAVKLLDAVGFQYAIIDSDGNKTGNLEVVTKPKRRKALYPHGAVVKHIKPYIDNIKVNTTVEIPVGKFDLATIYRSVSSNASKSWGTNSHSITTKDGKVVITRHEKLDDLGDLFSQLGIK